MWRSGLPGRHHRRGLDRARGQSSIATAATATATVARSGSASGTRWRRGGDGHTKEIDHDVIRLWWLLKKNESRWGCEAEMRGEGALRRVMWTSWLRRRRSRTRRDETRVARRFLNPKRGEARENVSERRSVGSARVVTWSSCDGKRERSWVRRRLKGCRVDAWMVRRFALLANGN